MKAHSMPRFLRKAALGAITIAGVAALAISGLSAQENELSEPFAKEARSSNGQPISGALSVGQTINYVLTYTPPESGSSGAVKISDTLGAGQTYVANSIVAPPGWDWAAAPDFASGGTEEFTHPGFSGGNAFVMTIPGVAGGTPSVGGDGTYPISVGNNIYAIYHHKAFSSSHTTHLIDPRGAFINCWDAVTLQTCAGSWPKPLDSVSTPGSFDGERTTPLAPHHFVLGTRIYYPSAQWDVSGTLDDESDDKTIPGIACWETATESPCNFLPLSTSFPGRVEGLYILTNIKNNITNFIAGISAIPSATDPGEARAFMLAGENVYCLELPSGSPCSGWTLTPLPNGIVTTGSNAYVHNDDMVLEISSSPQRLFVLSGGAPATVSCIDVNTGAKCSGWADSGDGQFASLTAGYSLSLQLNASGAETTGVCIHPAHAGLSHRCFGAATGSDSDASELPLDGVNSDFLVYAMFHVPGTATVLYPNSKNQRPVCRDFSSGSATICPVSVFQPDWWVGSATLDTRDYTYAVDPLAPDKCLLGLGDRGILWRFERDGTYPTVGCQGEEYRETFRLEQFFCAEMPTEAVWTAIDIANRPAELTGGTMTVLDAQNNVLATIAVGAANSYPLDIQALGAGTEITVVFAPAYSSAPKNAYELRIRFDANAQQQICYQAIVDGCDSISNSATLTDGRGTFNASTSLGPVVGGECGGALVNCLNVEAALEASGSGLANLTIGGLDGLMGLSDFTMTIEAAGWPVDHAPASMEGGAAVWNLSGVNPGDVVTVTMQGTKAGQGTVPGTDLCCNSVFSLVVEEREDEDAEEPEDPVIPHGEPGTIDYGLEKGVNSSSGGVIEFVIYATNHSTTPAPAGGATVVDTVPPGLTFEALDAPGWDCGSASQFPLQAGEQLTCRYTGAETLNPGGSFPGIKITAKATGETVTFENCATISPGEESGLVDGKLFNNEGCFSPEKGAHLPACDPETTTSSAGDCVCRFESMIEISDTMCGCPEGQSFVPGEGCAEGGISTPVTPPEEEPPACDPETAVLEGARCVCLYPNMTQASETACQCGANEELIPGAGCHPKPAAEPTVLRCDPETTRKTGEECACLYPNMRRIDEETCGCRRGEELIPGVGCRPREPAAPPPEERRMCDQVTTTTSGDGCACRHKGAEPTSPTACACPAGTTLDRALMACVPQCRDPLVLDRTLLICVPKCEDPMILNRETLKCECPEGMELEDGKCVEEGSFFDDIDINIGIGIGGSRGRSSEPTPDPAPHGP